MNYIVKQIQIPESEEEYPNLYGWGGAEEKSPAWKAKLDTMHFGSQFGTLLTNVGIITIWLA